MSDPRAGRKNQPASGELLWILLLGLVLFLLAALMLWGLGAVLDPSVETSSVNPFQVITDQASGYLPVGAIQLVIFVVGVILLLGIGAVLAWAIRKQLSGKTRVDHLAREMANAKDFKHLMEPAAKADAERLNASNAGNGVPLARLVSFQKDVLASYEWVQIWLMGPRAGKTSCVCVPQVLETHGPVLATTNKPDLVDMTRGPRSLEGTVYVQDLQGIIGEEPSWYWNPLSFVEDMETAEKLADVFISSSTDAGATQDAYFTSDGKRLLAHLFYAAKIGDRPITDVFTWSQDPNDKTARDLLLQHGYDTLASALWQIQGLTPKQRDGVYGTMRPWVTVLSYEKVIPWIRPNGNLNRPEFDHRSFCTSTDTIYLVSKEGPGSARAITAALVMAIMTSAEITGSRKPGRRLSPPMSCVLDEAANVVRWKELPDVYSHYGSRGIVVSTFFQSMKQIVEAWGENGAEKLWGASNIRVVGSGLSDEKFLPFVEKLIGTHDVVKKTATVGKGSRSTATSVHRESIMEVSDIAAIPGGRAILTGSGIPAGLIELVHYSKKPYADLVKQSQDYYESLAVERPSE